MARRIPGCIIFYTVIIHIVLIVFTCALWVLVILILQNSRLEFFRAEI